MNFLARLFLLLGHFLIAECYFDDIHVNDNQLSNCIENIADKLFYKQAVLIVNPDEDLSLSLLNSSIYVYSSENWTLEGISDEIKNFLFFIDDEEVFETIERIKLSANLVSPFTRMLIIVESQKHIHDLFDTFWGKNIFKVVAIDQKNLRAYTLDFSRFPCRAPIILNGFSCDTGINPKTFKLRNCNLKVSSSEYEAMLVDGNVSNSGAYMQLMKLISDKESLNLHFNKPSNKYAMEIGETLGYTKLLHDFETNVSEIYMGIAGGTYDTYTQFYCTYPVYEERMYLIVPRPHLLPMGKVVVSVSDETLAILFHLPFAVGIIMLKVFGKIMQERDFRNIWQSVSYLFTLQIGISVPRINVASHSLRFFLFCYFVHSLMYTNFWQANLYSISVKPLYEKPIKTLKDVLDSNLRMVFQPSIGLIFVFRGEEHDQIFQKYQPSQAADVDGDMEDFVKTRDFITAANEINLRKNRHYNKLYDKILVFRFFMVQLIKMYHPLYEQYSSRIMDIHEAGLFMKWMNEAEYDSFLQHIDQLREQKLKINFKLEPVLYIFAGCLVISTIVFVMEVAFWMVGRFCKKVMHCHQGSNFQIRH